MSHYVSWSVSLLALALAGSAFVQLRGQAEELARIRAEQASRREAERAVAPSPPPAPSAQPAPLPSADLGGPSVSMADVVARVLPAVVNIALSHGSPAPFGPMGVPFAGRGGDSLGSGVIVSADGLVVTNHHVVARGGRILVTLSDGREFAATLVGADPQTDMALLRLQTDGAQLTPLAYGDSSQLRQGDVVLAIGNPFGVGQTVTMGIVSATGRADMGIAEYEDFIQTDAAINPGNSGGALVSMRGELVGINTAILSRTGGSHGIGFAIPSNMVRPIVESLLRHGKVVRGWLGVTIQDVTPELASAMQLPSPRGVLVTGLEPGSPAEQAGIARGDVIERLDGERLLSTAQLRNLVATRGARATVRLEVVRNGERREIGVTLGERPQVPLAQQVPPAAAGGRGGPGVPRWGPALPLPPGIMPDLFGGSPAPPSPAPTFRSSDVGGLSLVDLDARVRAAFGIPDDVRYGAVVVGARAGTPGEAAGLFPGDVIVEVNRTPVTGVVQFASEYARAGGNAVLLVRRGPGSLYVLMR